MRNGKVRDERGPERGSDQGWAIHYDLATPPIKAYLEVEIEFVLAKRLPSMLAWDWVAAMDGFLSGSSQSPQGFRDRHVAV
jgi:hypothetical protein